MTSLTPYFLVLLNLTSPSSEFDRQKILPAIAVENCKHTKNASLKTKNQALKVAKILYSVEEELGVPDIMRGMTLSAGCLESGFNSHALGDRKFSKSRKPKAVGVLQMWKWYEKSYSVDRKDPRSSAEGWIKHIKRMLPKVKKQCKHRTVRRLWTAAWVTGIRYKKPEGRCNERPKHYKFFLKMRRIYEVRTSNSLMNSGK